MNWLIYIGGGWALLILAKYVLRYLIGCAYGKALNVITIPPFMLIPTLLTWIWLCIYVIRPYAVMIVFYQTLLGI